MKKDSTQDIPHEELPVEINTVEGKVKAEVIKFNLPRAAIAQLKENYFHLKDIDPNDKAGYKQLSIAVSELRTKRTSLDKKYKELNADALAFSRGLKKEKDELEELLREIEEPLKAKKDEIDNAAERAREEKDRQEQQRLQGRVATLLNNGMQFNGAFYVIGETISLDVVTLKSMKDEDFEALLSRVNIENEKILEAKRQKEIQEKEEREKLEKQRKEQEDVQKQQQEAREALQKEKDDLERQKAELKKQAVESRKMRLIGLGMLILPNGGMVYEAQIDDYGKKAIYAISENRITELESERATSSFEHIFQDAKQEIAKIKQLAQEYTDKKYQEEKNKEVLRMRTAERIAYLRGQFQMKNIPFGSMGRESEFANIKTIGINILDIETLTDDGWDQLMKEFHEQYDMTVIAENLERDKITKEKIRQKQEADKKAESDRQSMLSDAQKVNEYTVSLLCIEEPEIQNEELKVMMEDMVRIISRLKSFSHEQMIKTGDLPF